MLKYFVQLTEDLAMAAVFFGMLYAFVKFRFNKICRVVFLAGSALSVAASVFVSVQKNTNTTLKLPYWNRFTYHLLTVLLIASVALALLAVLWLAVKKWRFVTQYLVTAAGLCVLFTTAVYVLPDVLAYPFKFDLQGKSVFSTDFLYRIIGMVLGFLLVLLTGIAAFKLTKHAHHAAAVVFFDIAVLVSGFSVMGRYIQLLTQLQIIRQNRDRELFRFLFPILQFVNNNKDLFIFGVLACILAVALIQFVRSCRVREEYDNPAQLRKIRAGMRNRRRWAMVLALCVAMSVVNLTAIDAYNNKKPVEAPAEQCDMDSQNMYVSFSQVDDGHLHRFAYTTEKGTEIRFIVIKKPNSSSYGVGLDACDICGEAGYFERSGQIVCKRCDVVMNVNTIGFKGGCNPIVIDYTVRDGQIIVPIEGLILHERKFK